VSALPHYTPAARDEADRALLDRVVARDGAAFRELYIYYHRRLARFLMRLTPRYELVEEVINDTLWVVWNKAGEFRGDSRVSTWIMGIAYRRALKSLQAGNITAADTVSVDDQHLQAPDDLGVAEMSEWILSGMQHLPVEQRLVMEFAYGYGHSCEEIALIMNCPINTVKTRLFHAREKMRHLLPQLAGLEAMP
jgi:RNA polymerase sigma-70 factor (ECF subfamily)